jgi:hypothetical protein
MYRFPFQFEMTSDNWYDLFTSQGGYGVQIVRTTLPAIGGGQPTLYIIALLGYQQIQTHQHFHPLTQRPWMVFEWLGQQYAKVSQRQTIQQWWITITACPSQPMDTTSRFLFTRTTLVPKSLHPIIFTAATPYPTTKTTYLWEYASGARNSSNSRLVTKGATGRIT